jgi:hypothetical protein
LFVLKALKYILISILGGLFLISCTGVKPYQKVYLNQEDMELSGSKHEIFEINFQTYREGAAGANGGKSGGGCGCN